MIIICILISVISIFVGVGSIAYFGGGNGLVGSMWILSVLGAPMTFLYPLFLTTGLHKKIFLFPYIVIYSLYFLQYQLIAFGIYKYHNRLSLKIYAIGIAIIIISAIIMYCFQMGKFS